jgi:hypothetical protein
MEKIIEILTLEIERIEDLSDRFYSQGEAARGLCRKNEAKQLKAIIEVIQKKA